MDAETELESDPSPPAVASLAQLGKLGAGSDMERRLAVKLALSRALYVRGYDRDRLLKLFRFLDYVLTLRGRTCYAPIKATRRPG